MTLNFMENEEVEGKSLDDQLKDQLKVQSNTTSLNLQTICHEIDLGKAEKGGIKLKPFYQRDYKFTKKDESFLIESLIMGIPIPTIYLASDTSKFPHVSNVIDGQHRLRAIHRFLNNEFALTDLEKLKALNGKFFNDLPNFVKNRLSVQTSLNVNYIHIQDDPNLELEIFLRYNKGTHPMSKQEIRHVLFGSQFNDWVINEVDSLKDKKILAESFNMVKKRVADKTVHSDFILMMYILHFGIQSKFVGTPYYVDEIMHKCRKMNNDEIKKFIEKSQFLYSNMITFISYLNSHGIVNPFSKEIYAPDDKRHKFQVSILMIMASVVKYLVENQVKYHDFEGEELLEAIKDGLLESKFSSATSATTNYDLVNEAVQKIILKIEKL